MHRQSRQIINTIADVKGITEEDGDVSSMPVPKDKIVRMDESKSTKVSEMENLNGRNPTNVQKPRVKCNKYVGRKSHQKNKLQSPSSEGRPTFLGEASYLTPNKGEADVKPNCGTSEKLMKKPIDFAHVTIAEFGITPESFTAKPSVGKSLALKLRRRSTIGVRGSPENNSLIRYLAQQRRNRTKDPFTKASPFKHQNVGSLKDRISAFQSSFQSAQEDDNRACFPGLSQEESVSRAAGYSLNKQHEQSQLSEELSSEHKGVAYGENSKEELTNGDKTAASIQVCKIVSPSEEVPIIETTTAIISKKIPCTPPLSESGSLSLEIIPLTGIPKTPRNLTSECICEDFGSNTRSQLSRKKVTFAEELSLERFDETMPPVTTPQKGNLPSSEQSHNGSSCLRSVLKKTPVKLLMERVQEHTSNTTGMEGNKPLLFSDLSRSFEELRTDTSNAKTIDKTDVYSFEKPMKRQKVTFGEDLSPEVFDKTLPANTPLRKGATPISNPGSQSGSPSKVISPRREPLSQPNFDDCDGDDEYVKPLQESGAVPENMKEMNSFDNKRSCPRITRSSTKRKYINVSEETGVSILTKNAQDIKTLRKSKVQRGKENKSAPKRIPKVKLRGYGRKRGKKKVEKRLYGQREVASKKPLLSPILEIPEVFSSAPSSPNSPRTHILLFSDYSKSTNAHRGSMNEVVEQKKVFGRNQRQVPITNKRPNARDLDVVEASGIECQSLGGGPDPASTVNIEVLNVQENIQTENELESPLMSLEQKESDVCVNNRTNEEDSNDKTSCEQSESSLMTEHSSPVIVKSNSLLPRLNTIMQEIKSTSPFDTYDNKEHEKERAVLIENECVLESDHPSGNSEVLKELEFFNLQDIGISENTQTGCSVTDFGRERTADSDANVKGSKRPSRKGRRSTIYFSELENLHFEALGNNLSGSFTNEQESRIENDSEMFSDLHYSIEQSFLKASEDHEKKVRRSMRLHKNAENEGLAWIKMPIELHKNPLSDSARKSRRTMYASIFKESEKVHRRPENWIQFSAVGKENNEHVPVAGGSCKTRRRSMWASTSQETKNITQTRKKRMASLTYNDKNYQKESEVQVSFENHPNA
ncbi:cell division cycle-associated protein 2 isoform X2 [Dermochelys coriacea]|uniref:cell division cycle-associated protein 2 isoform X2 n=1 Tax=Dermochelys coriacea TaxID=27794 RepID=UPI0018E7A9EE|nr:cell division cycle-associated protein 2 isoform X2 [Dermochelys coriacea]XP_038240596.1 cell division cycle-associated protein 2 isoform X2 [Dermochelys coriacea]XP_038240598.1 cell division cycle-associated protein 2 isoform X2 [Dermochelys coriacea]XP_043358956.1 cell division cycle-associated protein 2 isoform X2 [Dermochelys coriacea]